MANKRVNPKIVVKGYMQKKIAQSQKLISNKSLSKFANKGKKK